jgi:hypothetical protein
VRLSLFLTRSSKSLSKFDFSIAISKEVIGDFRLWLKVLDLFCFCPMFVLFLFSVCSAYVIF